MYYTFLKELLFPFQLSATDDIRPQAGTLSCCLVSTMVNGYSTSTTRVLPLAHLSLMAPHECWCGCEVVGQRFLHVTIASADLLGCTYCVVWVVQISTVLYVYGQVACYWLHVPKQPRVCSHETPINSWPIRLPCQSIRLPHHYECRL